MTLTGIANAFCLPRPVRWSSICSTCPPSGLMRKVQLLWTHLCPHPRWRECLQRLRTVSGPCPVLSGNIVWQVRGAQRRWCVKPTWKEHILDRCRTGRGRHKAGLGVPPRCCPSQSRARNPGHQQGLYSRRFTAASPLRDPCPLSAPPPCLTRPCL